MKSIVSKRTKGAILVALTTFATATAVRATTIEVDIPSTTIFGDFLINGTPAPTDAFLFGEIYLRNLRTNDRVSLGPTNDGSYVRNVVPGDYEVYYEHVVGDQDVPQNGNAIIGELTVPPPSLFSVTRHIDIPMTTLSGTFSVNGETPPIGFSQNAYILAVDPYTRDEMVLGETRNGGFESFEIIPGSYDIFYDRLTGELLPGNDRAFLTQIDASLTGGIRPSRGHLTMPVPEPGAGILAGLVAPFFLLRRRSGSDLHAETGTPRTS